LVQILGPMVKNSKILGCFHMECPWYNCRTDRLNKALMSVCALLVLTQLLCERKYQTDGKNTSIMQIKSHYTKIHTYINSDIK
jgi:uncharacterized metal-binding protein